MADGARFIHVGHDLWLAAQDELLDEIGEDGLSETKFVRGAYGAGKSHFLAVVQDIARERNWVTCHVECKVDGVQIDRFETLYPRIAGKIRAGDLAANECDTDPIRMLLERWATRELNAIGVRLDTLVRPFEADSRLYARLSETVLRSNLPPDFARALIAFSRAYLAGDLEMTSAIAMWVRGTAERVPVPAQYLRRAFDAASKKAAPIILRPIGKGTAQEAMRGLLWLVRRAGYVGMVLCIDEVEELAKLGSRKRQDQALQALREYVDHAGGDGGYEHLCMYLAATPEMFENESYFPRYDALATRIQPLSDMVNWRGPVIDLDRTPLKTDELIAIASRIMDVHSAAYGNMSPTLNGDFVEDVVGALVRSRFRIAKPRLLARIVVDELERARQANSYAPPANVEALITNAAHALAKEAAI